MGRNRGVKGKCGKERKETKKGKVGGRREMGEV